MPLAIGKDEIIVCCLYICNILPRTEDNLIRHLRHCFEYPSSSDDLFADAPPDTVVLCTYLLNENF